MSLINDALKRAKQVQQQRQPQTDTSPPFRNPDDLPSGGRPSLLGASLGAAGLATLCVLFVWLWLQKSPSEPSTVNARTEPVNVSLTSATTETAPAPNPAAASDNQPKPAQTNTARGPSTPAEPTKVTAAVVTPVAPEPEPLRLQAVVFNPRRPSAIVGGKTLFLGDRYGEMRVVRITPDSVTLVARGGITNVLRLP